MAYPGDGGALPNEVLRLMGEEGAMMPESDVRRREDARLVNGRGRVDMRERKSEVRPPTDAGVGG